LISEFPPEVAGPPLVRALERGGLGPRRWAAIALGRLGWVDALPAVRLAREDGDPVVRQNADLASRILGALLPEEEEVQDEGYDPLFDGIAENES
jgi:HEAT repeat protein